MDLFDYANSKSNAKKSFEPLAMRMRPKNLNEVLGQKHIIGEGTFLYRAIVSDRLFSMIFYGPPGTGKTTLARVIAGATHAEFMQLNAVTSGKKDIMETVEKAQEIGKVYNRKSVLFIDEIHRFNKSQQDALLPYVEDGTVILIGATTENPYFEVNKALLSRAKIFELQPLMKEDIEVLLRRTLQDERDGLGMFQVEVDEETLTYIAYQSDGDARSALNTMEMAVLTTPPSPKGVIGLTIEIVKDCMQKKVVLYDKDGDNHYNSISAFIKSMRGTDPDGAVYYLARMIYGGEDPRFIARRIVICASEDVGNADPQALQVAVAAANAVDWIGMPEGRIILAQAAIYVACAPKSNAAIMAIDRAMADVSQIPIRTVPVHLKDAHYPGAKELGNGSGYQYAHNYPSHYVKQQFLPDELVDKCYYEPTTQGYENTIKQWLKFLKG